jgi:hypothetical protein
MSALATLELAWVLADAAAGVVAWQAGSKMGGKEGLAVQAVGVSLLVQAGFELMGKDRRALVSDARRRSA